MNSLTLRVSLIAAVVLAVFVALTALALDRAFLHSAETTVRERLTAQLHLLLADAELDAEGNLRMPEETREARLTLPGSGIYAEIRDERDTLLWRSPSALGIGLPLPPDDAFQRIAAGETRYFASALRVRWEFDADERPLRFVVFEDPRGFEMQLAEYRTTLWRWLGAMALLLLLAQAAALVWGLRPLRRVARELKAIETGDEERLHGRYPHELQGLTDNLNALLQRERARQTRYRDALGDLAHSLKTPLAVLRALDHRADDAERVVEEQVARMDAIVQHQLAHAATTGRPTLAAPVAVDQVVERLLASLRKVHRDKDLHLETAIDPGLRFHGDEGDLMELLGNLLDNAFKWTARRVRIEARCIERQLELTISDDGPGIPPDAVARILQRGVRLDETTPGHGLGLAMVRELVNAYGGTLEIGAAKWDGTKQRGALLRLRLPGC
ncbi:MAG: ATP-binding protein [Chromatiales bacterium]|jgi:two-component system sensor histidine kinase PhoQ|nr:ATP-binding protein [Chromatiales bacterium]MDX9766611.1 ATP-binding protein [Ectothiorhodospiraceae bacterium]